MTTLTWRQQAVAAFLSAQDGLRRVSHVTESPALTALHAALDVAEPLIRADAIRPSEPDTEFPATWAGGHALIIEFGDEEFSARCQCGVPLRTSLPASASIDLYALPWERHVMSLWRGGNPDDFPRRASQPATGGTE